MDRAPRRIDDRGQTAIDFAVAMGVFLLAVAFMLAFVPSMFAPFFGLGVGDEVVAERGAATLVDDLLASEDGSHQLDSQAVDDFFDGCENGQDAADQLSLRTENVFVGLYGQNGDVIRSCGEEPSDAETVARRIVSIDGTQHTIRVTVF